MFMLSKQKGDVAIGKAISYFLSNGYEVCLPIGDKRDYDLVVEKNGELARVQVKHGGLYNGKTTCVVALRVMGGNQSFYYTKRYSAESFEHLFVHTARGESFLLPWTGEIVKKSSINIDSSTYSSFKVNVQG
jgi:hypothetical protein